MRSITIVLATFLLACCTTKRKEVKENTRDFSKVEVEVLLQDSIHIRAIDIYNDSLIGYGFNRGYGFIDLSTNSNSMVDFLKTDTIDKRKNWVTEQRAVAFTDKSFFSLGVASPARLRKIDIDSKREKIVYTENHEKAFYNSIAFWNTKEGIAMGDPTDGCLSILITRDEGDTWSKVSCDDLPKTFDGEAAFAASNGNIAIVGDRTWVVSGGAKTRVFYSPDKGITWQVFTTPIVEGKETTGIYSVDFNTENDGIIFGGDYLSPKENRSNKAMTSDGGKTWQLIADMKEPGYKGCVQYIPGSKGRQIIAAGFTGIAISNDFGVTWKEISKEKFYTLRFINDSIAIAAGNKRIARVTFK